jgi:hypothetical protein
MQKVGAPSWVDCPVRVNVVPLAVKDAGQAGQSSRFVNETADAWAVAPRTVAMNK